jgi:hypothetical protein
LSLLLRLGWLQDALKAAPAAEDAAANALPGYEY